MEPKYRLILFATIFAVFFTTLTYVIPNYKMLWLSLEIIILPIVYYVGYEMLMDKQKEDFDTLVDSISSHMVNLNSENKNLKLKIQQLKKEKNK